MFEIPELTKFEKQSKQAALHIIDINENVFKESTKLFNKVTDNFFNIYTIKATEAFDTITKNVKETIEKTEITSVFGSAVKK
jgi:hypothetical protein